MGGFNLSKRYGKTHVFRTISERSAAVEAIAESLITLQPDEVLPYERLNNLMLNDRSLLYRARRKVEKEHGYVFGCVRGEGIKRLSTLTTVNQAVLTKASRAFERNVNQNVDFLTKSGQSIPQQERIEMNKHVANLNAIQASIRISKGDYGEIEHVTELPPLS